MESRVYGLVCIGIVLVSYRVDAKRSEKNDLVGRRKLGMRMNRDCSAREPENGIIDG